MRRRLIKTKHSIFGQGNSKRGHIQPLSFLSNASSLSFLFIFSVFPFHLPCLSFLCLSSHLLCLSSLSLSFSSFLSFLYIFSLFPFHLLCLSSLCLSFSSSVSQFSLSFLFIFSVSVLFVFPFHLLCLSYLCLCCCFFASYLSSSSSSIAHFALAPHYSKYCHSFSFLFISYYVSPLSVYHFVYLIYSHFCLTVSSVYISLLHFSRCLSLSLGLSSLSLSVFPF